MALNKVDICGMDTSKLPMMTHKRSRELLVRIKEGDTVSIYGVQFEYVR